MEGVKFRFVTEQVFYGNFPADTELGESLRKANLTKRKFDPVVVFEIQSVRKVDAKKTIFVALPVNGSRRRIVFRNTDNLPIDCL